MNTTWNADKKFDLKRMDSHACYINYFVRKEQLEDDLAKILEEVLGGLSDPQRSLIYRKGKTNPSHRKRKLGYYYDDTSYNLVKKIDKLIVNKFKY
jgi:hypothetical protein